MRDCCEEHNGSASYALTVERVAFLEACSAEAFRPFERGIRQVLPHPKASSHACPPPPAPPPAPWPASALASWWRSWPPCPKQGVGHDIRWSPQGTCVATDGACWSRSVAQACADARKKRQTASGREAQPSVADPPPPDRPPGDCAFGGGQLEPDLYRTRHILRQWIRVAAALEIPLGGWDQCDTPLRTEAGPSSL